MTLKDKIDEIKNRVAEEEKNAYENLKKGIVETVSNNVENWIRHGLEKIIIYPEIGMDPKAHTDGTLLTRRDDFGVFSPTEKMLYTYLVETEGLSLSSYLYDGKLCIIMNL